MKKAKKKKVPAASKRSATKVPMVWRIFHFKERFELPENIRKCRRSALEFSRDYVGDAGGDEAVAYQRQFALLSNGDGLEFGLLYGLYRLLVNMAAKQSRAFRGYLLDAKNQPLSDAQIGKLLKIETRRTSKLLRKYESVYLLEHVELPVFDLSVNDPPPKNDEEENGDDRGGNKQKSAGKPRSGGRGRTKAEKSAQGRKPLKKEERSNIVISNHKSGKMSNDKNGNGKDKTKGQKKRQGNKDNPNALEAPPSNAQPLEPQIPQKGGSIKFAAPSALKNIERLGNIAKKILSRYDPDAERFAFEIYNALKLPWDPTSEQGKREMGCFANVWQKAAGWQNASIPLPVLDELRARAIAEAGKIGHRRQNRKRGAVFCTVFKNLLYARCRNEAV